MNAGAQLLVRECTDADVLALEQHIPTGAAQVHAAQRSRARTGQTSFLVAWDDDRALGSCVIVWAEPSDHMTSVPASPARAPELAHLFVDPDSRGRGAATALVHASQQLILSRGDDRCTIGVAVDNEAAARLYERLGYQDTGRLDTCEYAWVDHAGGRHEMRETSRILTKPLLASRG